MQPILDHPPKCVRLFHVNHILFLPQLPVRDLARTPGSLLYPETGALEVDKRFVQSSGVFGVYSRGEL